jgi:hypothetical protein
VGDARFLPNTTGSGPVMATTQRLGALERLPKWLICVPLVLQWLALALRHGSATVPSSANPRITAGGLVGEAKTEYFEGMGDIACRATARWCIVKPHARREARVHAAMRRAGLSFPVVAKPDLGMCGFGVRLVRDAQDLNEYLAAFPEGQNVVLQTWLPDNGEAGIFYTRMPGEASGRITGLALRHFPQVVGDGVSTVGELIAASPRARRLLDPAHHELIIDTEAVPLPGKVVRLSTIGSTRVGGLYTNGRAQITPRLEAAIEAIVQDMPDFYFGRLDVRFSTLAALREGIGFRIMEINGAGSEAIEAWDPATPLWRALGTIFAKQRRLFAVGAAMRARGHKPIGLLRLARLHLHQQRLLAQYPPSN